MRAFVAIELSAGVRVRIRQMQNELAHERAEARWTRPSNLHLTLRFYGNASVSQCRKLAEALEIDLRSIPPFPLVFRGLGCFPNARAARVLFVSVSEPSPVGAARGSASVASSVGESTDALSRVQRAVERASRAQDFEAEERPFRAHVTVARMRKRSPILQPLLSRYADVELGQFLVDELILYESTLSKSGAKHEIRARIPIGSELSASGKVGDR